MTGEISARLTQIRERVNSICVRLGRDPDQVRLMAVTKTVPAQYAEEAWQQGIRLFGENRIPEGIEKFRAFRENHPPPETEVHMIGRLQRNKAKKAAEFFDCIQSVDRIELINELGALTDGRKTPLNILLEYHTGEESKAGFPDMDSLFAAAEIVLSHPGLAPLGLMTMAPYTGDQKTIRAAFRSCRIAADGLKKRFGFDYWSCLSMGMSGDFETALEEGSNLIRIGTAIFGERQ